MKNINKKYKPYWNVIKKPVVRDAFFDMVDREKDSLAYIKKLGPNEYEYITFDQFRNEVKKFGTYLRNRGFCDKKAVIIAKNSYEWFLTYFTLLCIGTLAIPLDAALKEQEIKNSLLKAKMDIIFTDSKKYPLIMGLKDEIEKTLGKEIQVYLLDEQTEGVENIFDMRKAAKDIEISDKEFCSYKIDPDEVKVYMFTSGTTSNPKVVQVSNRNITANVVSMQSCIYMDNKDRGLLLLPLHHVFGSTGLIYFLLAGCSMTFVDSIKKFPDNMKEYQPTILFLVPAVIDLMYRQVYRQVQKQNKEKMFKTMQFVSSTLCDMGIDVRRKIFKKVLDNFGGKFKLVFSGAAPLNKELVENYYAMGIDIYQGFGMTECSPVMSSESDFCRKAGSVGRAIPNVEVDIINVDENGIGEVRAKGDNVFKGYLDNPEETELMITDGWCNTGDLGYFDKQGYLHITGRKKDLIVFSNGKKVFPEEIEYLIKTELDYIKDIMIFLYQNDKEEKLVCRVLLDIKSDSKLANKSQEEIDKIIWEDMKGVNEKLPGYKYIKNVYISDEEFDKTTTMKIKRFKEIDKTIDQIKSGKLKGVK